MSSKQPKKIKLATRLEMAVHPILVVGGSRFNPYIELFDRQPENIYLQPLGSLMGFFKINNYASDSAYIVNFLASVLDKEYFQNPRRSVAESLDSALHKINLALAEIARGGNVDWVGNVESAICVIENDTLHFSISGLARVFLLRHGTIVDVSDGLSPENSEANPLKTFESVSSGNLEAGDKVIIATEDLLRIFSPNELKKAAARFSDDKFVQFLRTALTNELELCGTIVVEIREAQEPVESPQTQNDAFPEFNAFSQNTYDKLNINQAPPTSEAVPSEYADEKTGHIYIRGEYEEPAQPSHWDKAWPIIKEWALDFSEWTVRKSRGNIFIPLKKSWQKARITFRTWLKEQRDRRLNRPAKDLNLVQIGKSVFKIIPKTGTDATRNTSSIGPDLVIRLKAIFHQLPRRPQLPRMDQLKKLLPDFGKIRALFSGFNRRQKIIALSTVVLIIFVPLVWIKFQPADKPAVVEQAPPPDPIAEMLRQEKNMRPIGSMETLPDSRGAVSVIRTKDGTVSVSADKISYWNSQNVRSETSLPRQFSASSQSTYMADLDLVFILFDNKEVYSFSPATKKLTSNAISLPSGSGPYSLGTYLTYLYLLDPATNQIYRYPRAEGGFGEKTAWIKGSADLAGATELAVSDSIYVATGQKIRKFFRGQEQPFNQESPFSPLATTKIRTQSEFTGIYVLDRTNGRVVKLSLEGVILSQYYSPDLKNTSDLAIDEKSGRAYVATPEGIRIFPL